jgi:hypothetical protein
MLPSRMKLVMKTLGYEPRPAIMLHWRMDPFQPQSWLSSFQSTILIPISRQWSRTASFVSTGNAIRLPMEFKFKHTTGRIEFLFSLPDGTGFSLSQPRARR